LLRDQFVRQSPLPVLSPGLIPFLYDLSPLRLTDQFDLSDPLFRISDDFFHHPLKVSRDSPDGLSLVEIPAALQTSCDSIFPLDQPQGQVKFGGSCLSADSAHLQPADLEFLPPRVLQDHHDLKQRAPAQIPLRIDLLHHLLEWHFLMRIRAQRHLSLAPDQFPETRIPPEVGPEDQRVDEEPDDSFDLSTGAVRDDRSDAAILLAPLSHPHHLQY